MTGGFKKADFDGYNGAGVPCYSPKLKYEFDTSSVDLTGSFTDQYSYTGTGKLAGFKLEFDHKDVAVKLLIDSEEIFTICPDDLINHGFNDIAESLGIHYEPNKKLITFYPRFPICFETDVKIQARETAGEHARVYYMVKIEKVT